MGDNPFKGIYAARRRPAPFAVTPLQGHERAGLADGVRFELTIELPRCRFSRPVP